MNNNNLPDPLLCPHTALYLMNSLNRSHSAPAQQARITILSESEDDKPYIPRSPSIAISRARSSSYPTANYQGLPIQNRHATHVQQKRLPPKAIKLNPNYDLPTFMEN